MENNTFAQKMKNVLKKYGYYILLGVLILSVVLTLIIVGVKSSKKNNFVPTNTVITTPFVPVMNATIYKEYFGNELAYNDSLEQWETHNGIDLVAAAGSKVYSILDGEVVNVYNNTLEGQVVVIKHNNGIESTYGSLASDVLVKTGDTVTRGQEIGSISDSATNEYNTGAHLHFALHDNGQKIDPASYLNISTK